MWWETTIEKFPLQCKQEYDFWCRKNGIITVEFVQLSQRSTNKRECWRVVMEVSIISIVFSTVHSILMYQITVYFYDLLVIIISLISNFSIKFPIFLSPWHK